MVNQFIDIKNLIFLFVKLISILISSFTKKKEEKTLAHSVKDFNELVKKASPEDVITMANRVWENTELLFEVKVLQKNQLL